MSEPRTEAVEAAKRAAAGALAESFEGDPAGAPLLHAEYRLAADPPPRPPGS